MKQIIISLLMMAACCKGFAASKNINGVAVTYFVSSGQIVIGDGTKSAIPVGTVGRFDIPSQIDGCPVVALAENSFKLCTRLTMVTVPSSVNKIGAASFYCCSNVVSITLPNNLTKIEHETFSWCQNLRSIQIPSSVTCIERVAFHKCEKLECVDFPVGLKSIEYDAFLGCVSLCSSTGMTYQGNPCLLIPSSVESIGTAAFYGCRNLKYVVLSENVELGHQPFPSTIICNGLKICVNCGDVSCMYDGKVREYDVTLTSLDVQDSLLQDSAVWTSREDYKFINVGEYSPDISASEFEWTAQTPYDVEFVVQRQGTVVILPRDVSLASGSATKRYDGTPLVSGSITKGGSGFVDGECMVSAIGSQTDVGSSSNEVQLTWIGNGKATNYDLSITPGTLTVLPGLVADKGAEPGVGEVSAGGVSRFDATPVVYDGEGHTINVAKLETVTLAGSTPQFSYSLTSNGVYRTEPYSFTNACVTSVWYKVSATNYEDFVHESRVTILPREVTIRSGSASKAYDGTPLTRASFSVTDGSFVGEEGVELAYTGSQTLLGSSANTYDVGFKSGTCSGNYDITAEYGTLTVTPAGVCATPTLPQTEFVGSGVGLHFGGIEPGITIFYTTDGSPVTTNSTAYAGSVYVTDTTRVRAIAVRYGYLNSEELDVTVRCTAGVVDGEAESVASRYPNAYATLTNVVVTGHRRLAADFFTGCVALRHVVLPVELESIDADCFNAMPNFEWSYRDGYRYFAGWLFGYTANAVDEIVAKDVLCGVANGALVGCAAIRTFACESGAALRWIGDRAFEGCVKLQNVTLSDGVLRIGDQAFAGCTKMTDFIIPGSVKSIGDEAFRQCTSLTHAWFGYGVESVGDRAFYGDWHISEVDLPSTVTNIGNDAFGGDSSIIRASLRCDVGKKISDIFSNYEHIREITVRESSANIVNGCFSGCTELLSVRYLGNCPKIDGDGSSLYKSAGWIISESGGVTTTNTEALVSYVTEGSEGWDGVTGSEALPQAWPLVGSYRRSIAFWDKPTYLCQFDSNGGTLGIQDTYQTSEMPFVLPPEPVQSGYKFAGWWTKPSGGLNVSSGTLFIEGVYTMLYAHWIKGHWVFLDPNGGTVVNDFITYVEETTYGVLPTPVKSGYAFGGWLYGATVIGVDTEICEQQDHTLVAQWTANNYKVRYHANGGTGELDEQEYVYGTEQNLRRNVYLRKGYSFAGWSTNETDAVIYADGAAVSNLTIVANGVVDLYAVWHEGGAVDPTNVMFTFGGDADWSQVTEGVVLTNGGVTCRYETLWRSGAITHNESSVLKTRVFGPGTISFFWKVSCEKWRTAKLDYLEFSIDGVPQKPWINGETGWTNMVYSVEGAMEHILTWTYAKDAEGTDGADCGSVCAVVWTPRLESLADYLNCTNMTFTTSGSATWEGDEDVSHDGTASLRSGVIGDGEECVLESSVEGSGTLSFWWKVSSETFRNYQIDYVTVFVDGVEKEWIGGEVDWQNVSVVVEGAGHHLVQWKYIKDSEPDSADGQDCAWIDEVTWSPSAAAPDPIPEIVDPTPEKIAEVLEEATDPKLAEHVTSETEYAAFRVWSGIVKPAGGGETPAGAADVMSAPNAWMSYALGSETLLEAAPTDADLTVEAFEPTSGEAGKFDFTVSVKDVEVGGAAQTEAQREQVKENLKQVFGLEGTTSLDDGAKPFSSGNVDITFGTPEDGKVKFTAGPKDATQQTFFMKVRVK